MPSTITRTSWTDDSGGGTDGSIVNNAELQLIYDKIDQFFGGGASYPVFYFGKGIGLDGVATASAPAVSASGKISRYYDSTLKRQMVSRNAGPYIQESPLTQTFRGVGRTHPDADKAAYQCWGKYDEVVFDDGTRISGDDYDLDGLVWDITASGAGGLDTGAEGASQWLERYIIRKSSDGTISTLLHRAKDWTVDQTWASGLDIDYNLRTVTTPHTKLSQGFTPAVTGLRPFVDIYVRKAGSPTGNVWVTLESNSAGMPDNTPIATSCKFDISKFRTIYGFIRFYFPSPVSLTASTLYHIVLQGDFTASDANYFQWVADTSSGYAGGAAAALDTGVWTALAAGAADFYFKDYVEQNNTAVTMPSGYDQKCYVGPVYNDSGSNFDGFTQYDRRVTPLETQKIGSTTSTVALLTSLAAFIPPGPIAIRCGYANTGDQVDGYLCPVPNGFAMDGTPNLGGAQFARSNGTVVDGPYVTGPPILTDYQGMYIAVGATTGHFWLVDWEWF